VACGVFIGLYGMCVLCARYFVCGVCFCVRVC